MPTVLVFCPNLIGDTVMATPAIRALRSSFTESRFIGVIKPGVRPTLEGTDLIDEFVDFDARSKNPDRRMFAVIRRLRSLKPDIAVLFPNSFRSALMAAASGARKRVGYARGGRGPLLTDRLQPLRDDRGRFVPTPILDDYLAIVARLGCSTESRAIEVGTTADDEEAADESCRSLGIDPNRPIVSLNTGGAFGPAKAWPAASFATLAKRLAAEKQVQVVMLCGPAERNEARAIVSEANHPLVVGLADEELSIGLTKAMIRRSTLLITTDSGPRHFAAGLDVPVISLFGPTHIAWTLTHFPKALHLHHSVSCGPCQRPVCPQSHHRCLRDMSPDAVFRAASRILDGSIPNVETIEAV